MSMPDDKTLDRIATYGCMAMQVDLSGIYARIGQIHMQETISDMRLLSSRLAATIERLEHGLRRPS